jgi:hypothetical protein
MPCPFPAAGSGPSRAQCGAALILAVGSAVLAASLGQWLFAGLPRVGDEVSYAFQGRIFSAGRLYLPPPAVPEAFSLDNVILTSDRWCSKYPPGFPILLAAGWLAGTPWLVNPVLFGFAVYGLFRLGSRLSGPSTGLLGAGLFATLPFAFLQAASFMSHIASLALAVWCLSLVADGDCALSRTRLVAAGLLGGMAFLVRPVSAVFLLFIPVLLILTQAYSRGQRFRASAFLVAGSLLPLAFLLWVQWRSFGSPFVSGYAVFDPWEGFLGNRHGSRPLADIFRDNFSWYREHLSNALWKTPGSPFLWLLLVLVRPRKQDLVAASAAISLLLGYLCHYYHDVIYGGPRFAFEATGFLALLAARGLGNAGEVLDSLARRAGLRSVPSPATTAAVVAGLLAVATVAREVPRIQAHARSYMGVPNDPMAGADRAGVGPDALVLVDFEDPRRSMAYTGADSPAYIGYVLRNALEPSSGRQVFARAIPGKELELSETYPRAETWRAIVSLSLPTVDETPINGPSVFQGIRWVRLDAGRPGGAAREREGEVIP